MNATIENEKENIAGGDRHARHLRARTAAGIRARLRSQPADRAGLREAPQAPAVSVDQRGLRHVRRRRVRPRVLAAGLWPDQQAALDLRLFQAADGPDHPRLRHRRRPGLHPVPPLQLDRSGTGLDPHRQRGQLAGDHAIPGPYRARRTDPPGRRRLAEARLHVCGRRHRCADAHHREPAGPGHRTHLQHRQSGQQLFGARTRHDDAGAGAALPRVPRQRRQGRTDRNILGRLLRQGLPGRAEPGAQDRQHDGRPRLGAQGGDGRCAGPHLRRLPRPGRAGAGTGPARLIGGDAAARAEDRRRHISRHPRRRAGPARGAAPARRRRHLPVQPGSGPHRARDPTRAAPRLPVEGLAHLRARALWDSNPALWHPAARPGHRPALRATAARGGRSRLRDRHPLLGSRALAGLRRAPRRRLDSA
jgi:hypothetical protein